MEDRYQEMAYDERLLRQFFDNHRQEIADNGFSRRVMRNLPGRAARLNRWWTVFCAIMGLVAFIANNGLAVLRGCLQGLWANFTTSEFFYSNPLTLCFALLLMMVLGGYTLVMSER